MRTMNVVLLTISLSGVCCCPAQDRTLRYPQCLATAPMPGTIVLTMYTRCDSSKSSLSAARQTRGTSSLPSTTPCTPMRASRKSKDTSPQALLEGLDFDHIQKEYGVLGASLNGPKLCLPDWVEIDVGAERDFDGLAAVWCAQLNMGKNTSVGEIATYKPVTIARNSGLGWNKGTTVILLDDAEGNTWVMKGFELGLEPQYTYDEFLAALPGVYQKLPEGWKVRVKTLEEDLIEKPEGGVATIMKDEFFNVYDKTGPGMTNYKP
jgi:hypothetical protein